jgi:hypothetical protein
MGVNPGSPGFTVGEEIGQGRMHWVSGVNPTSSCGGELAGLGRVGRELGCGLGCAGTLGPGGLKRFSNFCF